MQAAFYISGHGLGHSTRAVVTISALAARGHHVHVVTVSPEAVFHDVLQRFADKIRLRRDANVLDPGIKQSDAVTVDALSSFCAMRDFLLTWEDRVKAEMDWLLGSGIDCVLLDAPFIPGVAARRLHIPSLLISNFTFDTIFDGLLCELLQHSNYNEWAMVSKHLKELYSQTDYLLRLPGAIPSHLFDFRTSIQPDSICAYGSFERAAYDSMIPSGPDLLPDSIAVNIRASLKMISSENSIPLQPFSNNQILAALEKSFQKGIEHTSRTYNIPLVVRLATDRKSEIRKRLKIPSEFRVVLITFGGHNVTKTSTGTNGSNYESESNPFIQPNRLVPAGWHALIAVPGPKGDLVDGFIKSSPEAVTLASADAYIPDLIQASDVVVGKCGYGTCSEVVAHRVPLVYVPRPGFVEEEGLITNLMKPFGVLVQMPQQDFYNGQWDRFILEAHELQSTGPAVNISTAGAETVADLVEEIVLVRRSISKAK